MRKEFDYGSTKWLDYENPTYDELVACVEEFSLDNTSSKDLLTQTEFSRARVLPHYIHLTMYFPTDRYDTTTLWESKLDILVFQSTLITIHDAPLNGLLEFEKKLESQYIVQKHTEDLTGYKLFTSLLKLLYGIISEEIHEVSGDLKKVEDKIFSGEEEYMVYTLAAVNRIILSCNRTLKNHAQLYTTILEQKQLFADVRFIEYIEELHTQYKFLESQVENTKAILDDLHETGFLLVQLNSTRSMNLITLIAFAMTPIATMATFISTNILVGTKLGTPFYMYVLLAISGVIGMVMFAYFNRKRSYVSKHL